MSGRILGAPWSYVPRHIAESEPEVRAADGWLVCCTSSDEIARLLSAAPDLLEALEVARAILAQGCLSPKAVALADAAIKKAGR